MKIFGTKILLKINKSKVYGGKKKPNKNFKEYYYL